LKTFWNLFNIQNGPFKAFKDAFADRFEPILLNPARI
jgi:hypothetical protein